MAFETCIDTSGFFAVLVREDSMHDRAMKWLKDAGARLKPAVTTDYILDETATLLKSRGFGHLLSPFFHRLRSSEFIRIEWMDARRFRETSDFFFQHANHDYSFTDCASFVVMRELGIVEALAKDKHFAEAGFKPLLVKR